MCMKEMEMNLTTLPEGMVVFQAPSCPTTDRRKRWGLRLETVLFADDPDAFLSNMDIMYFFSASRLPSGCSYGCPTPTLEERDLGKTPEELLAAMRYSTRKHIRLAMKDKGLRIEQHVMPDDDMLEAFLVHHARFASTRGISGGSLAYLKRLRESGAMHLIYICNETGEALAGMIFLTLQERAYFSLGFSYFRLFTEKEASKRASLANLKLYWTGILLAKESGCSVLDYGGIGGGMFDGRLEQVDHFKSGFGGKPVTRWMAYKAFSWKGCVAVWIMRLRARQMSNWQEPPREGQAHT